MVTLPAPLSTAKSNVMAPLISTGTTNIPESSFNGTSTKEDDFLFGTGANGGVVVTTFGGPASDAAAIVMSALCQKRTHAPQQTHSVISRVRVRTVCSTRLPERLLPHLPA